MTISKLDVVCVITVGAWLGCCSYVFRCLKDYAKEARFWREHCEKLETGYDLWRDQCKKAEESLDYCKRECDKESMRRNLEKGVSHFLEKELRAERKRTAKLLTNSAVVKRQAMEVDKRWEEVNTRWGEVAEKERLILRCMDADVYPLGPTSILWVRVLQIQQAWRRYAAVREYRFAEVERCKVW